MIPVLMLLISYGVIVSWLAWRHFEPLLTLGGTLLAASIYFVLTTWLLGITLKESTTGIEVFPRVCISFLPTFLLIPFMIRAIAVWTEALRRWSMGEDRIQEVRSYDRADAAAAEGRLEEALKLYREGAEKHPGDPVPHQRMADVYLKLDERDSAAKELRAAADLFEDQEKAVIAALRAFELSSDGGAHLESLRTRITNSKLRDALDRRAAASSKPIPRFLLDLREQFFNGLFHLLVPHVAVANHALRIDDKNGRPALNAPLRRDRAVGPAVDDHGPGEFFAFDRGLEGFDRGVAVDPQQDERLVFELFHERPLVRIHRPARPSPVAEKVQNDHFAFQIGKLESFAVDGCAFQIGRLFADFKVGRSIKVQEGLGHPSAGGRFESDLGVLVLYGL
jgi:tetratricopeptide (TPR) repeat protein